MCSFLRRLLWGWLAIELITLCWLTPVAAQVETPSTLRAVGLTLSPAQPIMGAEAILTFQLVDSQDTPVRGATIRAELRAPVTAYGAPSPPPVVVAWGMPDQDPGHYRLAFPTNFPGRWWLDVTCLGPAGQFGQFSYFLTVTPQFGLVPATSNTLLFLQSSQRQTYYRVDPVQGTVATFAADAIVRAAGHWWAVQRTVTPVAQPDAPPGVQSWRLTILITDLESGKILSPIVLDTLPASSQSTATDTPPLAFAVAGNPQQASLYVYWAWTADHQWRARIGSIDLGQATLGFTTAVGGALTGSYLFVQMGTSDDGNELIVVEHTVALGTADINRLSRFDSRTLTMQVTNTFRDDGTATTCLFSTLGINGLTHGVPARWYSLCPLTGNQFALALWNPETAALVFTRTLVAAADSTFTLDQAQHRVLILNQHRPAVLASADLGTGAVIYPSATENDEPRSLLTRLARWLLDWLDQSVAAQSLPSLWAGVDPQGQWLYTVVPVIQNDRVGDGIWVLNGRTFEVVDHWLPGYRITGVAVAHNGTPVAIIPGDETDRLALLDPTHGTPHVILQLPGHVAGIAAS